MSEQDPRPNTTYGFTQRRARKSHRCYRCERRIEDGECYTQDTYYAPFGDGRRFCNRCAAALVMEEVEWMMRHRAGLEERYPNLRERSSSSPQIESAQTTGTEPSSNGSRASCT